MSRPTVVSRDGTRLSSWCNDGAGVPVVVSNGLGAPVEVLDAKQDADDRVTVVVDEAA
jgi:hypothetical protein